MIGAIIGDVVGSRFEFRNHLSKDFNFFDTECTYTDDTVMTCAVADLMLNNRKKLGEKTVISMFQKYGKTYPYAGYGVRFSNWLFSPDPKPYNSCGNGSAMRVSPVGWVAESEQEVKDLSYKVTAVTHNHPDGLKGAEVTAMCIFKALHGASKDDILKYAYEEYRYYDLKTCAEWQQETNGMHGKEICQISVPQAMACFDEGTDFEDVIRNCVSIGGDTDTIAAIAGGIAEAYYGVPEYMVQTAYLYLPKPLEKITRAFRAEFCK